jgi:hypothetical protein
MYIFRSSLKSERGAIQLDVVSLCLSIRLWPDISAQIRRVIPIVSHIDP